MQHQVVIAQMLKQVGKTENIFDGNIDNTVDISLKEGDFKGDYSVDSVDFKLDYYGTNWYVEIEATVGRTD